ncbi:uncharacterized protein LOC130656626 [Hydractinia symbiolongicarpus]|uniref:uncharacterized protein LOC130656626 n=1 Tax=Hydractinia symbiolongicarpus TaxID=13093 RepID=UPI00254F31FE|nr:uncharacterized protein LOC130656626 [Hydractinia symbiolongicarpus]
MSVTKNVYDENMSCENIGKLHTDKNVSTSKDLMHVQPNKLNKDLLVCRNKNVQPVISKQTYRLPHCSVLDRVKQFLPQIASANDSLVGIVAEEKDKLDIENLNDEEAFIEMDVALVDNELLLSDDDNNDDTDDDNDNEEEVSDSNCKPQCFINLKKSLLIEEVKKVESQEGELASI